FEVDEGAAAVNDQLMAAEKTAVSSFASRQNALTDHKLLIHYRNPPSYRQLLTNYRTPTSCQQLLSFGDRQGLNTPINRNKPRSREKNHTLVSHTQSQNALPDHNKLLIIAENQKLLRDRQNMQVNYGRPRSSEKDQRISRNRNRLRSNQGYQNMLFSRNQPLSHKKGKGINRSRLPSHSENRSHVNSQNMLINRNKLPSHKKNPSFNCCKLLRYRKNQDQVNSQNALNRKGHALLRHWGSQKLPSKVDLLAMKAPVVSRRQQLGEQASTAHDAEAKAPLIIEDSEDGHDNEHCPDVMDPPHTKSKAAAKRRYKPKPPDAGAMWQAIKDAYEEGVQHRLRSQSKFQDPYYKLCMRAYHDIPSGSYPIWFETAKAKVEEFLNSDTVRP
ncbi:unnamed protein product, partial [Effrenium voratum]